MRSKGCDVGQVSYHRTHSECYSIFIYFIFFNFISFKAEWGAGGRQREEDVNLPLSRKPDVGAQSLHEEIMT